MISVKNRFHGYGSLKYVYREGRSVRGPLFSIKSIKNPRRSVYRVAIVVSRKVSKSAVARNRMRRRLYATVRLLEADIIEPYDIVITVFSDGVMNADSKSLRGQIKKQFKEAGILVKRVEHL